MNLLVLSGEGAINDLRKPQPHAIAVQVRDGNRQPIPGAVVVFTLPPDGPSAEFPDGSRMATVVADDKGRAAARIAKPNGVPGNFDILVNASHEGETARATVRQYNMEVQRQRSNRRWLTIAAIAGAAAAGGAVAATRGGNGGSAAAPSIGITPASGSVGPPR